MKLVSWRMDRLNFLVGRHLIHEVTSPQAFGMLREKNLAVRYPERTFATVRSPYSKKQTKISEPYSKKI